MNKRLPRGAAAFFFAFVIAAGAARGEGRFQRFEVKFPGELTDVITEDLDGDGLKDILAIHTDKNQEPPARVLTVFFQDRQGFDRSRGFSWNFPPEVAAVDVGDVLPAAGRELAFITESGISAASVSRTGVGPLREVMKTQSVVAIAYEQSVPYYNFVRDYTGDGKDDILVCGFYDANLLRQADDYRWIPDRINLRPGMDIDAFDMQFMSGSQEHPLFRVAYYVPRVFSRDYDGDGLLDLVANFRNEVFVFRQTPEGFTDRPAKHWQVKLFREEPSRRRGGSWPNLEFEDLNGDGKMDLVASQTVGEFGNMRSRTVLFWGGGEGLDLNRPDQEFKTEKPAFGLYIKDVNNDARLDIAMPTFEVSAWSAGKAFLTGDVTVEWAYFIQRPDRKFNPAPDRVIPITLKFSMTRFRLESGIPNVFGDFNGDGFPDQAVGAGKNLLVISLRDREGRPLGVEERIEVPVSIITKAVDLNGDGLSDLVIHYFEDPEHPGDLKVFLNQGGWNRGP